MSWGNLEAGPRCFYIGSDPEVFVVDGPNLLPAFSFLPSKKNKLQGTRSWAFWDGFQGEFEVSPELCIAYMIDGVRGGLEAVLGAAQKANQNAKLTARNVFQIPVATLKASADEHVILGCDPSQNAYGMCGEHVIDARKLRYRFAGGHLHFGLNNSFDILSQENAEKIIRGLDAVLGIWSVGAAASLDNPIRRKYYGLAGEYRLPKHGLEYRTLSNFWLTHPGIGNLVCMLARAIVNDFPNQTILKDWQAHPQETVEAINNCDVKSARKLLEANKFVLAQFVKNSSLWSAPDSPMIERVFDVGMHGLECVVKDPEDFITNWKLQSEDYWQGHADGRMESWKDLAQIQLSVTSLAL